MIFWVAQGSFRQLKVLLQLLFLITVGCNFIEIGLVLDERRLF